MTPFPTLDETTRHARLAPPRPGAAVVIDTDAANEIDDQFALAWALLAPDRLRLLATCAAPFSFAHRRAEVLRARVARDDPANAGAEDHELLALHAGRLAFWEARGWDPATLELPSFCTPAEGMRRSLAEIERVHALLGQPGAAADGRAFAGSTRYLTALAARDAPDTSIATEASPATTRLIELAEAVAGNDEPLYVLALGCLTNIANALLLEPELVRRLVVVWTAGYPSHAPHVNRAFNLEQDVAATRLVLDSGVPLVYIPGYHVGAQLRLSLPEMEAFVRGRGAIGAYLHELYTHNPLWPLAGIDGLHAQAAYSWVIWDLVCIAWMLEPGWLPGTLVRTPHLGDDLRWRPGGPGRHVMREVHAVHRDAIFGDLFERLAALPPLAPG
ncbi:MAG: nucleoside hydrolase [Rubrivivax sp.]|nr:nucleoside hydrolase [Rubrivivax sp.]